MLPNMEGSIMSKRIKISVSLRPDQLEELDKKGNRSKIIQEALDSHFNKEDRIVNLLSSMDGKLDTLIIKKITKPQLKKKVSKRKLKKKKIEKIEKPKTLIAKLKILFS